MKNLFLLSLSLVVLLFGCKGDFLKTDLSLIDDYLAENNLTATVTTAEGVTYVEEVAGAGTSPTLASTVSVHYEGFLLDGTKFDSSLDRGVASEFPLTNVIRGWQIGIPLMKVGSKGKLLIPSSLAYGGNPPFGSGIPANAVLLFSVQLLKVK